MLGRKHAHQTIMPDLPAHISFLPLKLSSSPSSPCCSSSSSSGNVPGMEQRNGGRAGRRGRRKGEGMEGRKWVDVLGRNPFEEAVQNAGMFLQSSLAKFGLEDWTKRKKLAAGRGGGEEPLERRARGEPVVSGRKLSEEAVQNAESFLQSSFAKWGLGERINFEGRKREQGGQSGGVLERGFLYWGSNSIVEETGQKTGASVQSSLVRWGLEERIQRGRRRRAVEQLQRGRVREAAVLSIRNPFGKALQNAGALLQSTLAKWKSEGENAKDFIGEFLTNGGGRGWDGILPLPLRGFCSTSMALAAEIDSNASAQQRQQKVQTEQSGGGSGTAIERRVEKTPGDRSERDQQRKRGNGSQAGQDGAGEERVLISEILIQDKDGQDVKDAELLATVRGALKACKPNFALTTTEVQEDVHRIITTGFFASCMPSAEDTRDGVRLIFKVEPNEELKGLVCNGANALPTRVIEDAFRDEYGKVVNIQRLNRVLDTLNGWYRDRGLFGQVTDVEILSNGVIQVQVAEAEVNNINIRFLDRKTGEPTTGKTQPETLLRQLTTKKGQVYSLQQGRRDVETVFTMGIMEDVNLVPQAAGDTGMVDLTMNVVERVTGGFSAGGGLSGNGITNGALSGLVGSFAYSHRNAFGRNQKLNISLERGQVDSMFRVNYTDPWIEGDDKRTSRSVNMQNSRSPGAIVHGLQRDVRAPDPSQGGVTIGRLMAGVDYSRPLRPKWSGTAGIHFQRAGARDDHGEPKVADMYGGPITFSGRAYDDMLVAKLESVYTDSGDNGSSQLVCNTEQGLPIAADWLFFNRINVRARQGLRLGPLRVIASFSGGTVMGDLAPHEAFPIGGTNSVRGYDEGAVGSGRSCIVGSAEASLPLYGPVEGALFADFGTDLKSGKTVPGDPAGVRGKPGSGFGYGAGIRVDSPLGPLRLEYAFNDNQARRFHFGIGYRN